MAESTKATAKLQSKTEVFIKPLNMRVIQFLVIGTGPLVMNAFSEKQRQKMADDQAAGPSAKTLRRREPKDFDAMYEGYKHYSAEGWLGIPAMAIKSAVIRAAGQAGYVMTTSKLAIFIVPDGYDRVDRQPLVRITKGEPSPVKHYVRLANGTPDIVQRPLWEPGWEAQVTVRYDADIFTHEDVANLMHRAGVVGVLAGRASSSRSVGMGWGSFRLGSAQDMGADGGEVTS